MAKEKSTPQVNTPEESVEEEAPKKREVGPGAWEIPIPDGAEFGGLPEGTFLAKCEEEPKESISSKGDPQTEFIYTIRDPEYPDLDGKTGKFWCSRKPKSWWNLTNTLDAMDVPYEIKKDANGKPVVFRFDPMDCVGAFCKVVVKTGTDPNKGTSRNKIVQVISASESSAEMSSVEEGGDELPPF